MPTIDPHSSHVTFINTLRCRPADQDRVVELNIEIVERVARRADGFISATVHRSVDGQTVINYLQWRSTEDLEAMQRSAEFRAIAAGFSGLIDFEARQCDIAHVRSSDHPPDQERF